MPYFSKVMVAAALASLGACVDQRPSLLVGTSSLAVEVTAPTDLGEESRRLVTPIRQATIAVTALDSEGTTDTSFSADVDVFTHFLGTLTPTPGTDVAPATMTLSAGVGQATVDLPLSYGPTYLWVEDVKGSGATFATGTSSVFWNREPFLVDVSRPVDETVLAALSHSPLEGKQVLVSTSEHGANGRLIVTGVYAQGYTLSDVDCTTKPCSAEPYAHVYVFTFGRPRDTAGTAIEVGQTVGSVSGGVGEFNGFTELNFPQTALVSADVDESLVPEPVKLEGSWLLSPTGANGMIRLEQLESALVLVEGGVVCPLDSTYDKYSQWKLDVGEGCGTPMNVVTSGAVPGFDPAGIVGRALPRVIGTLRAVSIGSFNVWIMYPRRMADVTIP